MAKSPGERNCPDRDAAISGILTRSVDSSVCLRFLPHGVSRLRREASVRFLFVRYSPNAGRRTRLRLPIARGHHQDYYFEPERKRSAPICGVWGAGCVDHPGSTGLLVTGSPGRRFGPGADPARPKLRAGIVGDRAKTPARRKQTRVASRSCWCTLPPWRYIQDTRIIKGFSSCRHRPRSTRLLIQPDDIPAWILKPGRDLRCVGADRLHDLAAVLHDRFHYRLGVFHHNVEDHSRLRAGGTAEYPDSAHLANPVVERRAAVAAFANVPAE